MVRFVLDTDTLSYIMRKELDVVEELYLTLETPKAEIATTQFNNAELWYGYYLAKLKGRKIPDLQGILSELRIFPFCERASDCYAMIKAKLVTSGKILDEIDMLIASIAIVNNATLVTNNTKHFQRIEGLKLENWKKKARK